MHVIILPSWYKDPEHLGSGLFFKQQAEALASIGCIVSIVYLEARSLRYFSLKKFFTTNHFQISEREENGVLEFCMKGWSPLPQTKFGSKLWVWLTLKLIKRYIQIKGRPDLIHAHCALSAGIAAARFKKKTGLPFLVTEHSSAFYFGDIKTWQNGLLSKVYNNASETFAVSKILADNMQQFCSKKVSILPNFLNTRFFNANDALPIKKDSNDFVFFSLGNLIPNKGYSNLLKAFKIAFENRENFKLYIGGVGYLENELKEQVNYLGLSNKVKFLGHLTQSEVRDYLNFSDAFVLASEYETFGIVYIEAMACGKPVIATINGGPREFVTKECGYLVNSNNINELASALRNLKENISIYDADRIKQYVYERFDSKKLATELFGIYNNNLV
jgi:glycosyltransferase involved in cell wall biosynthesis